MEVEQRSCTPVLLIADRSSKERSSCYGGLLSNAVSTHTVTCDSGQQVFGFQAKSLKMRQRRLALRG